MTDTLQILSATDVAASLLAAWPSVRAPLLAAAAEAHTAYARALTPLQRTRIRSTLGDTTSGTFWAATPPTLNGPDESALRAWLNSPNEAGSRRLIVERFAKFGLVAGGADVAYADPETAVAAGRALGHPDIVWLDGLLDAGDVPAAWLGLERWAREVPVQPNTLPAPELPLRLRQRWLSAWPLADASAIAHRASVVRAALWSSLEGGRSVPAELRDADPDAPLGWPGAMPGLLFDDAALVASLSCGADARMRDRIVAGVASLPHSEIPIWLENAPGARTERAAWWGSDEDTLESRACLTQMQRRWRIDDALVADALRDAEGATDGAASWRDIVALSASAALPSEVGRALEEGTDWLSFDAPGEGVLPVLWRDAMRLHPAWDDEWASRFEKLLGEPTPQISETLDAYPSPYASAATRLNTDQSPLSSYTHGLNDAIEEAYGDVFSPADPFSQR